jgi:hypothetical protein
MAHLINRTSFDAVFRDLNNRFKTEAPVVHPMRWQGVDVSKRPEMRCYELVNVTLRVPLYGEECLTTYAEQISPNLPWADVHFKERVCGEPLNPPPSYKIWPWGSNAEKFTGPHGEFNHSYPERLWPKHAGMTDKGELKDTRFDPEWDAYGSVMNEMHRGIRHTYGDLNDVVALLHKDPLTRQAWIPLFFPEDTGIGDGARKPCTLGYQFMRRGNEMHIYYPLRSCDYVRHFRDDIYLAIRLLLWMLSQLRELEPKQWDFVKPGEYVMHATSLHVFTNDLAKL